MSPSLHKVGLHRYALLLALLALLVIVSGAFITSSEVAAKQSQTAVSPVPNAGLHRALSIALALLTVVLAVWISSQATRAWLRAVAWSGVAVLFTDAALGWSAPPLPANIGVFHALLAHVFFSLVVAIVVGTSARWSRGPEMVDGSLRPLLRPLALAVPPVVFLQITLGAAYRHDIATVMPHIAIAMGVVFLALIGSSVILQNFPRPIAMRRAAIALISVVLLQVSLGITAFVFLVLNAAGTPYFVLATVGHVAVGAATLAASVVMAMEVRRSVTPKTKGP